MKTSERGIELIKAFEGLRLRSYQDSVGVWTIGYGHTRGVRQDMRITPQQAEEYLITDLSNTETFVMRNLDGEHVNQCQFDALVSFTFNLGPGNLAKSTLLKKVKADPDDATIAGEFEKWCRAGGKYLKGLHRRRKAEAQLYFECA